MAVVFPLPAGAIASCSRAPDVAIRRTRSACPALRFTPFAVSSSNATSTRVSGTVRAPRLPGGGEQPLLSGQDRGRGVQVGAGDRVHRGAIGAPQHRGFDDPVVGSGQTGRPAVQHLDGEPVDHGFDLVRGQGEGADLPVRFGPDMPHLPGRPAGLHRRQDPVGRILHPAAASGVTGTVPVGGGWRWPTMAAMAGSPPRTSAACCRQVARCSARLRGSCLACRVSKVARWARCSDSTGVGGRP